MRQHETRDERLLRETNDYYHFAGSETEHIIIITGKLTIVMVALILVIQFVQWALP